MNQGEFTDQEAAAHGIKQFGTTAVVENMSEIKFHADSVIDTLYVNGDNSTNVRDTYLLETDPMTVIAGAVLKPLTLAGHKFFSGIDLVTGSGECRLSDKKK